ncbi:UNVERIFIED_CONTAM: hypothetical protein GTU68_039947 [Idotea baltica]|nr:hypothetical protein [Idotea baltica]
MKAIETVEGPGVPLLLDDIDTDRIIPARYLRCVTFDGLGEYAFEDDREQDPDHPFNKDCYQNAKILVAGRNFGCGSSREHAPQSLMRWGIAGVIAESFAEIFFGNCTSLGIPAVIADRSDLDALCSAIEADPNLEIVLDLKGGEVRYADTTIKTQIADSARDSLVTGQWDFLSQLLDAKSDIESTVASVPYMSGFNG